MHAISERGGPDKTMRDIINKVKIMTAGEQGMVVDFGSEISAEINMHVQHLVRRLADQDVVGITEIVPTYRSVMLYFDPVVINREELAAIVKRHLQPKDTEDGPQNSSKVIHVPVCYGGVFGPDMDFVVRRTGLKEAEVVNVHISKPYLVYMLGFTPGFPYLGGLPDKLVVPRLEKSRVKIPGGSVGIAGRQTGCYAVQSIGSWRIIGRTPLKAFNPEMPDPFLFAAGDYIQFKSVDVDTFFEIRREVEAGSYLPEISYMREGEYV